MAMVQTKKTRFEPIVIEIDGKEVEICVCGQTTNEDRTCSGAHNELNAQMDEDTDSVSTGEANPKITKTMTVEEMLNKLNEENMSGHQCACGGNCGCNH